MTETITDLDYWHRLDPALYAPFISSKTGHMQWAAQERADPSVKHLVSVLKARRVIRTEFCRRAGIHRRSLEEWQRGAYLVKHATLRNLYQVLGLEMLPVPAGTDAWARIGDLERQQLRLREELHALRSRNAYLEQAMVNQRATLNRYVMDAHRGADGRVI